MLLRCITYSYCAISRYSIGLPGICALGLGYHVSFSDYNALVLQKLTSINVALNDTTTTTDSNHTNSDKACTNTTYYDSNRTRYYAGDWISVSIRLLLGQRYSLILTAETLYTLDTCKKVSIYTLYHNTHCNTYIRFISYVLACLLVYTVYRIGVLYAQDSSGEGRRGTDGE